MKYFTLRLTPTQPLHIDDPAGVPGRAVRGMLAAAALRTCAPGADHEKGACGASCLYWPLFNPKSGLRIGQGCATTEDDIYPYLATAATCAAFPGFRAAERHGVQDVLIRTWIYEENPHTYAPYTPRCPTCAAPLIGLTGQYSRVGDRQFAAIETQADPVETAHRPINRRRGQGLDTFTQTGWTLPPNTYYAARIACPDALETPLRTLLFRDLFIGGGRTRGMGAVRAELIARNDPAATLRARIAEFNKAVRAERRFYAAMSGVELEDDGTWFFTLDFPDGAILDPIHLNNPLAGLRAMRGVRISREWRTASTHGGRNVAAGVRARTVQTVRGTIVCSVPPEENRTQVEGALGYLEANGIGLERERGYGAVIVCDPLHLEVEPL
jgi:hypothetical protein